MGWYGYNSFAPYVSVAERKRQAAKEIIKLKKKGHVCEPVIVEGRNIANTFWGKAWCNHLGVYSDYDNRLPRGRTYVRNGSIIDLKISAGTIIALVSGSSIYKIKILIKKVVASQWQKIVNECSGKIGSMIELLQGKFSQSVMEIMSDAKKGLFPRVNEIKFDCSCPDGANMCKHIAAVLYGVGARLDEKPEALFLLRETDHFELIAKASASTMIKASSSKSELVLEDSSLSSLFGIDIAAPSSTLKPKLRKSATKPKKKPNPIKAKGKAKT